MIKDFWNAFCLVDIIYKHKYMALFTKITVFAKYSLKLYGIWSIVNLLEICKTVYSRAMFSSTFSHRAVLYARWREADSWHGFYIGLHSAGWYVSFTAVTRSDLPVIVSSDISDSLMRSSYCVDRWFVPRLIVLLFMCDSYTLQECCSCWVLFYFSSPCVSLQRRCFRNNRVVYSTVFACCRCIRGFL